MTKEEILNLVEDLSAEDLFSYIQQGLVTLDELRNTGNLDATKIRAILALQKQSDKYDDEMWEKSQYGNELLLTDYLSKFPLGKHAFKAKERIESLINLRKEETFKKQMLLKKLVKSPNSFTAEQIFELVQKQEITINDLINSDIPEEVINALEKFQIPALDLGDTHNVIPDGFTEVYFWGIPGSGKTTALSAILSTANTEGILEIATGPGFDYMNRLINIFHSSIGYLPAPSPVEYTQYLPFVLRKDRQKPRSISLIELSGEIFECFYFKNAEKRLKSPFHEKTFTTLMNYLKGKNRKLHFFFIDYEQQNLKDDYGYTQANYLESAAIFFQNNDIFKNSTDGIYIILTKSDLMQCKNEERLNYGKDYLKKDGYSNFINSLKYRCKEHSINDGELHLEPFTLGKVYFQQICNLERESAKKILDILFKKVPAKSQTILSVFNR